jgi:hypothetical protein
MKTVEQALLDKILFIGKEMPIGFTYDTRPKFIVLGTIQEFIDETTPPPQEKNK